MYGILTMINRKVNELYYRYVDKSVRVKQADGHLANEHINIFTCPKKV